jgi:hypothetical protein
MGCDGMKLGHGQPTHLPANLPFRLLSRSKLNLNDFPARSSQAILTPLTDPCRGLKMSCESFDEVQLITLEGRNIPRPYRTSTL